MCAVLTESLPAAVATRLRREVGGDVHTDALTRGIYSTDASIYQIVPRAVIAPRSDDDVAAVLAAARDHDMSVTPRGAGTSQGGQAVGSGLVVDVSRHMDRVLHVDPDSRTAVVEPGVVLADLNRTLAPFGLFFPIDVATASRATLGGMAANNSSGARSIRYGIMADHVRAITALLADGTPMRVEARGEEHHPAPKADLHARGRRTGLIDRVAALREREAEELERRVPKVLRHVAGYNLQRVDAEGEGLAELLVGSEGTLAFFTQLELALAPIPPCRALAVCHFSTLHAALDAVQHVVALGPSAVELSDGTLIRLARQNPAFRSRVERFTRGDPAALLFVEFAGAEQEPLSKAVLELEQRMAGMPDAGVVVPVLAPAEQANVWAVRRAGLNIVMSGRSARKPVSIIEDCAIPLERLAEWGDRLTGVFDHHGVDGTWYAHASVGCLHVRPSLDLKDAEDVGRLRAIAEEAHDIVRDLGGSFSGEHGDGLIRSEFIEPMMGSRLTRTFEEIKAAFDPGHVLNPGKIVHPPPMDDRAAFRYHPDYRALPVVSALDWSEDGGLLTAVERCNNNGACRKRDPDVMCPSYRVTSEERDSTRGRANALRLALTGQLGSEGLASQELATAMELCVGCKACRRECPSGVDMARMKTEYLAHARARDGISRRDSAFARLPRLAPRIGRVAPVANLLTSVTPRAVRERLLGVAGARTLPRWSSKPFRDVEAREGGANPDGRPVVLFADTFNRWFEPENLRATLRVLRGTGHGVRPMPDFGRPLCCGRTFLSAGLVDEAREELLRTAAVLVPLIEAGVVVVGLEPSCLLTFRDEAAALLPAAASRVLAEGTFLLEELLLQTPDEALGFRDDTRDGAVADASPGAAVALVHGHCHQKAFGVESATTEVLTRVQGLDVRSLESTCCGMAGSFGYEAEHQSVSRAMAELDLMPAVRASDPNVWIVADGFSCRHQVADLSDRHPVHAVRLLDRALSAGPLAPAP